MDDQDGRAQKARTFPKRKKEGKARQGHALQRQPKRRPFRVPQTARLGVKGSSTPATLLGESAPPECYEGMSLELVWTEDQTLPGLPWRKGWLDLEHHPQLKPLEARGRATDVGRYWKLRAMPQVSAALQGPLATVVSTPWRLEPGALPSWLENEPGARRAFELQTAYCERVWWMWTRTGAAYNWTRWAQDVLLFALISGFYLGEGIARHKALDLGDGPRVYLVPDLPHLIAPWTVHEWILQGETPVGFVQRTSEIDSYGQQGPNRIAVPWSKLIHIAHQPAGPTDLEGRSILRSAYTPLQMLQDTYQLQGLSQEVNALGTMVIEEDADTPFDTDQRADLEEHLESYKGAHVPWVILPRGAKLNYQSPQTSVADLTNQEAIFARAAMMAMGADHRLIALQQHGSFAAREDASKEARDQWDMLALMIASGAESYLRRMLETNFPADAARGLIFVPRVDWTRVDVRDPQSRANTLKTLADGGFIDPLDERTRQVVAVEFSLPEPEQVPAPAPTIGDDAADPNPTTPDGQEGQEPL